MKERIGLLDWKIAEVKPDSMPDDYGQCDYTCLEIRIQESLHDDVRDVTLWHERIHAMLYSAGIRKHDERLVDALAHAIARWLRDNGGSAANAQAD